MRATEQRVQVAGKANRLENDMTVEYVHRAGVFVKSHERLDVFEQIESILLFYKRAMLVASVPVMYFSCVVFPCCS